MRVVVLGSGAVAIATAYYLCAQGAEVVVLADSPVQPDQDSAVWAGSGLMSPGLSAPANAPGTTLGLRWRAIPSLLPWGVQFFRNSVASRFTQNLLQNTRLSLYSQYEYHKLAVSEDLQFGHSPRGTLALFRSAKAMAQGVAQAHFLKQVDIAHERLDPEGLIAMEPALAPIAHRLAGAVHFPDDETAHADEFFQALKALCTDRGVEFHAAQDRLVVEAAGWRKQRRVRAVSAGTNSLAADAFVVAADSNSSSIARQLGVPLAMASLLSDTVNLDAAWFEQAGVNVPQYPLVDGHSYAVPRHSDGCLQVVGVPELASESAPRGQRGAGRLTGTIRKFYPGYSAASSAAMPRVQSFQQPVTANGVPIIGGTPVENVFVNTGHGAADWMMACGSGVIVAALVMQSLGNWQLPNTLRAMDLSPFAYRRR